MNHVLKAKLIKRLKNALVSNRLSVDSIQRLLVDIRALLELTNESGRHKALKFNCDWLLHPRLTGPMAQRFIKAIDERAVRSVERAGLQDWPDSPGDTFFDLSGFVENELRDRFTLFKMETEMAEFFERHKIGKLPHPSAATWRDFEVLFCQLVEDRPWEYQNNKDPVRYINRATLTMCRRDGHPDPNVFPYYLQWDLLWNDEVRLQARIEFCKRTLQSTM
jgi:hypothetical protein